jgi:hypothetical protein
VAHAATYAPVYAHAAQVLSQVYMRRKICGFDYISRINQPSALTAHKICLQKTEITLSGIQIQPSALNTEPYPLRQIYYFFPYTFIHYYFNPIPNIN